MVSTGYDLTVHEDGPYVLPSIGNHDFGCMSHYIIDRREILWAGRMSRLDIEAGRQQERLLKRPSPPATVPTFQRWLFGCGMRARIRAVCRKILRR